MTDDEVRDGTEALAHNPDQTVGPVDNPDARLTAKPSQGRLDEYQQIFVVQRVAMFDSPKTVADAVKEEFGIEISRQAIEEYDPEKRPNIAEKWRALHEATRKAFLEETGKEPAAHRAVRIRRLARMAERAEASRNMVLAASLYEQIAKETGGLFTNRRELTGKNGAALVPAPASTMDLSRLTTEQLEELERLTVLATVTEPVSDPAAPPVPDGG